MIPSFLLAKMYVKGSLTNTDTGFEFTLKNIIDSTLLIGIGPISVGDKNYTGEMITLILPEKSVSGAELSTQNTIAIRMGAPLKVSVSGDRLSIGLQKISVAATTSDIGKIKFEISDSVSG